MASNKVFLESLHFLCISIVLLQFHGLTISLSHLVCSVFQVSEIWIPYAVRTHLDLVYEWYLRMAELPIIKQVSQACFYRQPVFDLYAAAASQVTVPDVSDGAVRWVDDQ